MKWGLLIVGIHGASASTLSAVLTGSNLVQRNGFRLGSYWCAAIGDYPAEVYALKVAGWDYRHNSIDQAIKQNAIIPNIDNATTGLYSAIIGSSDYAARIEAIPPTHPSVEAAVTQVKADIQDFRARHGLDRIIVLNSSSPMYCGTDQHAGWASASAYSIGAIEEGCDWVEFTPSDSVTSALTQRANDTGSRIAGRDGSTGQTILKLVIRDFLKARGLNIHTWYSTNLIGNRDGIVLAHPDYNVTKFRDKKSVLKLDSNLVDRHVVEIQFVEPAGDNKESWDCVFFEGWQNKMMSMRINWHGADSYLAAPLMLDVISGLIRAQEKAHQPGILKQLGLFFKSPLAIVDAEYSALQDEFRRFVLD